MLGDSQAEDSGNNQRGDAQHSAGRTEHKDPLQETFLTSSALMRHNWVNDEGELKTSLASLPQSMSMMDISVDSQKRVYPNVVWIHLELYACLFLSPDILCLYPRRWGSLAGAISNEILNTELWFLRNDVEL